MKNTLLSSQYNVPFLRYFSICFLLVIAKHGASQEYSKEQLFDKNISSVMIFRKGNPLSYPVISLSGEQLTVHFDELSGEPHMYSYEIIHCDRNWNQSDILFFDYAEGMQTQFVNNFSLSRTQYMRYTHYFFDFPHADLRIKLPGNYIIKVYNDDTSELVFTKKFFVVDELVTIDARTINTSKVSSFETEQELDFTVAAKQELPHKQAFISDAEAVIFQNLQYNGYERYLKPRFIQNEVLNFDYDGETNFKAGNEFYNLNLKNIQATNNEIAYYQVEGETLHVHLRPNRPRKDQTYLVYQDLNGRTFVDVDNPLFDGFLDAEYMKVHFYYDASSISDKVYLFGGFTSFLLDKNYELEYDVATGLHKNSVFMKQGVYNYKFVTEEDGMPSETQTSGNFRFTENEYSIVVYYRRPGEFFDRLIGFRTIQFPKE